MKIAVLGSGAMGGLYSSYLSRHNEVTVIDVNAALVEKVNAEGLEVQEPDGTSNVFHPHAVLSTEGMEPVDLIIVFVKQKLIQLRNIFCQIDRNNSISC